MMLSLRKMCRCLLLGFTSLLGCALFTACDDDGAALGLEWQHPSDLTLPMGFAETDDVPMYTKRWQMPPGFAGFPERWNTRVREYVQENLE